MLQQSQHKTKSRAYKILIQYHHQRKHTQQHSLIYNVQQREII